MAYPKSRPTPSGDLVTAMNAVAPSDWSAFFHDRLQSVDPRAPLGGITGGGWRVVYNDEPNVMTAAGRRKLLRG